MAWIKVHQGLSDHRKTLVAAHLLDTDPDLVVGKLIRLWTWALDHAEGDGLLPPLPREYFGRVAAHRRPAAFIAALIEAGFVEEVAGGRLRLHDWQDYAGKLNEHRRRDRERKRRSNSDPGAGLPSVLRRNSAEIPAEFQRHSSGIELEKEKEKEKEKEQAAAGAAPSSFAPALPQRRPLSVLYEQEFGKHVTPIAAQLLGELEDTYDLECIQHAFEEAVRANRRELRYVEAICRAHKERGDCYAGKPARAPPAKAPAHDPDSIKARVLARLDAAARGGQV